MTAYGVISLLVSNHSAWLAIAGLAVLVVVLGWIAHDEHRARLASAHGPDAWRPFCERAIADGEALLTMIDGEPLQATAILDEMRAWRDRVYPGLREHRGLSFARAYAQAGHPASDVVDPFARMALSIRGQIRYLGTLR
jgi:hypothetical protein